MTARHLARYRPRSDRHQSDHLRFGVDGEETHRETARLEDTPALITSGEISHALVVAAFYLLGQERADGRQ